jgi:multimeric flavodoxin WrbA
LDIIGMLPVQLRRAIEEICVPDEEWEGENDLVCIGSPTWWLTTSMPIRSFMESDLTKRLLDRKLFAALRLFADMLQKIAALPMPAG